MKLFQVSEGLAEVQGHHTGARKILVGILCGLVFGDCFTLGCWAKVRSCEAVLGGCL